MAEVFIPETITVHLGAPGSYAQNITVPFPDYIKNVASSEIYPTWPENAIRANIYAQITYVMNRIFTEFYRSRGYDFDITNSTQYDQFFVPGRNIFDNIDRIVDDIFNSYIERQGAVGPIFSAYCNGTTVTCNGLSQWGTVSLATSGNTPYEILQRYYGDDIDIEMNVSVRPNIPSYRGYSISRGENDDTVRLIQLRLNRISDNYPGIPKIYPIDGIFGEQTENAVEQFQRIFNLTPDGVVGKNTWYKIIFIYNGVKRLSELNSEGISISEYNQQYPDAVRLGDTGNSVSVLQYYLSVLSAFYPAVPDVQVNGVFGNDTLAAVVAFQKAFGLNPDGIVGDRTWHQIYRAFLGIYDTETKIEGGTAEYGGEPLSVGSSGTAVRQLQEYLSYISDTFESIPKVVPTGNFGQRTQAAVKAFQEIYGYSPTGIAGPATWAEIGAAYTDLKLGYRKNPGQFPGYVIQTEAEE